MAKNGIYFYKLSSPYSQDITKLCRLSINEIDSNFFNLESYDIESAEFIREEKTLVLTRVNGDKLIVDLSDMVYDLEANASCTDSGVTLTMHYDGKNGEKDIKVDNLITLDMLRNKIEELIGTDILTKVITDGTLKGYGTLDSPLGLKGTERTGMYAPVISRIDLTNGEKLPEVAKLGTRYATIEYVNDYGYLYNDAGMNKINAHVAEEGRGWRVPSKADWDMMLNLIEPCENRNHNDAACHKELGMYAGKYLKSNCGWLGQVECSCAATVPITGCTIDNGTLGGDDGYVDDTDDYGIPSINMDSPSGVDKFGMSILPTGIATLDAHGKPQANSYKEKAVLWTTSHVYNDVEQDQYVKVFDWNKSGVVQEAECPSPYYGVRLVKDYDGSNYFDTEYIDGVPYKTILFPEIRQIWLASNYAKKEGFVQYTANGEVPEVVEVNNGEVNEKRKAVFLNEWNGCYWEKKELQEGDTVVVENPCFDTTDGQTTTNIKWIDSEGTEHCVEVVLPDVAQYNIEYRVFTTSEDSCDQDLINTDYLAIERLLRTIIPMIEQETNNRIKGDENLQEQIDRLSSSTSDISSEIERLDEKIDAETVRAEVKEEELENKISALTNDLASEVAARKAVDGQDGPNYIPNEYTSIISGASSLNDADIKLDAALKEEIERAKAAEQGFNGVQLDYTQDYTMMASEKLGYNLVLKTIDGVEEHFIKIKFDGNFGEI